MKLSSIALILPALILSFAALSRAADPATSQPDGDAEGLAQPPSERASVGPATSQPALKILGSEYSDTAVGIALRPPRDCSEVHEPVADEVIQFRVEQKSWIIKVSRILFDNKTPLDVYKDTYGEKQDGLLQVTIDHLQREISTGTVTRNEVIEIGELKAGMLAIRYVPADQKPRLLQQAIIESPFYPNRMYYVVEMTSPGASKASVASGQEDPAEREAFDAFTDMLDTVRIMNLSKIFDDQRDRLVRTRALFYNWNLNRLRAALVPEQWFRLIQDGKDMGYVYEVQEIDPEGKVAGKEMIKIGLRARTYPQAGAQVDSETWMYSTVDMKHENWSTVQSTTDDKGKLVDSSTELGSTDESDRAVAIEPENGFNARANAHGGPLGEGNIDLHAERNMKVSFRRKHEPPLPMAQELPAFYIPLVFGHLLPKIVPLDDPKSYMFAVYAEDGTGRQIKTRYIDVDPPETVTINGVPHQAIPVKDRIGLEGVLTTHYISPEGVFLESVTSIPNENGGASNFVMLPADSDTLNKIWDKPNLSPPSAVPADGN
jgi:hypothetical protein